jgi:hypothetical protein
MMLSKFLSHSNGRGTGQVSGWNPVQNPSAASPLRAARARFNNLEARRHFGLFFSNFN